MNNIKNFFKEKYARKSNFSPKHCEDFLKDIHTPQLTAEEALECEGPIIKKDINKCLQDMGNGKSPCNDNVEYHEFSSNSWTQTYIFLIYLNNNTGYW